MTHNKQSGQIMILGLIFSAILLSMIAGLVGYWMKQIMHERQSVARAKAISVAEAGIEMAVWKLNNQAGYNGESNTSYGGGTYTITVTTVNGSTKQIKADAYVPSASNPTGHHIIQVTTTVGTVNVGFNYGVQVGLGGLELNNTATINGNVYSNADIIGTNSANIQGTAVVAGNHKISGVDVGGNVVAHTVENGSRITGNATVSVLDNSDVTGSVIADTINRCNIGGNATYDLKTSCSVGGVENTPNNSDYVPSPTVDLPITPDLVSDWEAEAAAGGTIGSQSFSSGTRNLGPIKINGDLTLTNTAQLVLTGTVWVTGNITLSNSAILKLSPGYSSLSGLVLAGTSGSATGGYINIQNNVQILGSGTAGSYLMMLSQKASDTATAINYNNGGTAVILYAGDGIIDVSNSGTMKEVTAKKLRISNSATVSYESGLANANFSSGPGGGWQVQPGTWLLIK